MKLGIQFFRLIIYTGRKGGGEKGDESRLEGRELEKFLIFSDLRTNKKRIRPRNLIFIKCRMSFFRKRSTDHIFGSKHVTNSTNLTFYGPKRVITRGNPKNFLIFKSVRIFCGQNYCKKKKINTKTT